tara:strand:+ start:823 stop:948 length:126 start_codon:yes stop_codon:yes gene_type:complete
MMTLAFIGMTALSAVGCEDDAEDEIEDVADEVEEAADEVAD